jgi:hypothetical protein
MNGSSDKLENPYAPPAAADSAWAPSNVPPSAPLIETSLPKTFGVLSIIFASLVLCFGLLSSCGGLVGQGLFRAGELSSNAVEKNRSSRRRCRALGRFISLSASRALS